jgi:MinD superfamily P-loop ATPase
MKIVIDEQKCKESGECTKVCPEKAISLVDGKAVIDNSKCDADGICIPACVNSAISLRED